MPRELGIGPGASSECGSRVDVEPSAWLMKLKRGEQEAENIYHPTNSALPCAAIKHTKVVSEEENGGARQVYRVFFPPRRPSPPAHYHIRFTEELKVLEGKLDIYVGREGRHILLNPHDSFKVEIGQVQRA